jgi:hypothetical protein
MDGVRRSSDVGEARTVGGESKHQVKILNAKF